MRFNRLLLTTATVLLTAVATVSAQPQANPATPLTTRAPTTGPASPETAAKVAAAMAEGDAYNARPLRRDDSDTTGIARAATTRSATGAAPVPIDFTRIAFALVIVVGLIVASRVLFKRFFAGASAPATSRAVKVIGRTSLSPRQQILLLQIGGRVVVVGESNGMLNTLAQIEDPDEVARLLGQLQDEQIHRANSFGGLFGRVQTRYDDESAHAAEPAGMTAARTQAAALEEEQVGHARSELSGLVDKVRALRNQIDP